MCNSVTTEVFFMVFLGRVVISRNLKVQHFKYLIEDADVCMEHITG